MRSIEFQELLVKWEDSVTIWALAGPDGSDYKTYFIQASKYLIC